MGKYGSYINQTDPTKSIEEELKGVDLRRQYTSLTDREKELVFAKIKGYSMIPPTIERLYSDTYYLGGEKFFNGGRNIFDFWKNMLSKDVFSGSFFTRKPYLVLSGAIGIGKSTITRLCMAMTLCKLLCMKDPYKTLNIVPKILSFLIAHRNENSAEVEFKRWLLVDVMSNSPFFHNVKPSAFKYKVVTSGPRGSMGLGNDLIFATLGEINFWPGETGKTALSTTLIRFKSRFSKEQLELVGHFIIDSSARGATDATEWFKENTPSELYYSCTPAHYEVRPGMYEESAGRTFRVFTGDGGSIPPQILPKDFEPDPTKFDPSKIIKVPIQLLPDYKMNLVKSLQDLSGISTGSSDLFFGGDISCIKSASTIKNYVPEVITIDFYDKNDRIIKKLEPMLSVIPINTKIYLGLDLSAAQGGDATGISACIFDKWVEVGGIKQPKIRCLFMLAVKNKEGQELSLYHIEQLIQDLSRKYDVTVSADQAFSRGIFQMCMRENIKTYGRISTDNVPCEPALYLKYILQQGFITLPENLRFQREAADLYYTAKGKVDHPKIASRILDNTGEEPEKGSKDVWDSLCQASYSLKLAIDSGEYDNGVDLSIKTFDMATTSNKEKTRETFQNMLESIYSF